MENIISKLMFTVGYIIFYEIKKISNFSQYLSEAVDIPLAILIFLPIIIFHSTIIFPLLLYLSSSLYISLYISAHCYTNTFSLPLHLQPIYCKIKDCILQINIPKLI